MIANCHYCGKEFKRKPSVLKMSKLHFCSQDCFKKYKLDKRPVVICENCGKEFNKMPSNIASKNHHLCSRACSAEFQSKVFKKAIEYTVDENGCHICTSHGTNTSGYPQIRHKGRKMLLDRYLYSLKHGEIPKGMCLLHSCDNPSCINVEHLTLGTHKENMRDMADKGRAAINWGIKSGSAKLTEEEVMEIRNSKMPSRKIAKMYGVNKSAILNIRSRKTWKYLP